jgi:acetyl-CoA acetyltransferase
MKNMGIKNVNCAPKDVPHLNESVGMAAEAIAQGLCHTALVVYTGANFEGRYRGGGENAAQFAKGGRQFNAPWGNHGGYDFVTILPHAMYNMKYGGTHEDMGPMVVNQHRNGRMTPWAFYVNQAANEPMLTLEDYVTSRYILKPLRLWDCDRPIHCVTAYVFTTAERAKTMRQKPVYVLGHSQHNYPVRSTHCTLEEMEGGAALAAQMIYEASGLNAKTLDVFNPYDGYATMVQFWLEGFGWHGVKKGEAYDFWKGDNIRVEGPHPFSSGGGNLGCGRTRSSFYTDAVEQLRGRVGIMEGFNDPVKHRPMAGKRKVNVKAETAVCFFSPVLSGGCLALGTSPD